MATNRVNTLNSSQMSFMGQIGRYAYTESSRDCVDDPPQQRVRPPWASIPWVRGLSSSFSLIPQASIPW